MAGRAPVRLRLLLLAEPTGTAGVRLVGFRHDGRLIARTALLERAIAPMACLLREPVDLLLSMRTTPDHVASTLHAVVQTRRAAHALGLPSGACASSPPRVAIPLGDFVLARVERRHPGDLLAEAHAQLRFILEVGPESPAERALRRMQP